MGSTASTTLAIAWKLFKSRGLVVLGWGLMSGLALWTSSPGFAEQPLPILIFLRGAVLGVACLLALPLNHYGWTQVGAALLSGVAFCVATSLPGLLLGSGIGLASVLGWILGLLAVILTLPVLSLSIVKPGIWAAPWAIGAMRGWVPPVGALVVAANVVTAALGVFARANSLPRVAMLTVGAAMGLQYSIYPVLSYAVHASTEVYNQRSVAKPPEKS